MVGESFATQAVGGSDKINSFFNANTRPSAFAPQAADVPRTEPKRGCVTDFASAEESERLSVPPPPAAVTMASGMAPLSDAPPSRLPELPPLEMSLSFAPVASAPPNGLAAAAAPVRCACRGHGGAGGRPRPGARRGSDRFCQCRLRDQRAVLDRLGQARWRAATSMPKPGWCCLTTTGPRGARALRGAGGRVRPAVPPLVAAVVLDARWWQRPCPPPGPAVRPAPRRPAMRAGPPLPP